MGTVVFVEDARLAIPVPVVHGDWAEIPLAVRARVLADWEQIRGRIPDRIIRLERQIIEKQQRMNNEDDFQMCCTLNSEIAELASRINDLHLWYRTQQDIGPESGTGEESASRMHG